MRKVVEKNKKKKKKKVTYRATLRELKSVIFVTLDTTEKIF